MPLVLDTNAALDWLVFRNPAMAPIVAALEAQQARCIATSAMRDELAHVLARGLAAERGIQVPDALATWDRLVQLVPPAGPAPATRLHCTDPDDQIFIDLAQAASARWLLTRDRALLRLAGRARRLDIRIVVPEAWHA